MTALILAAPFCLALGWMWSVRAFRADRSSWRNKVSIVAVCLISIAVIAFPICFVTLPRVDFSSARAGAEMSNQADVIEKWHRVVFKFTAAGLVLSFFGKAKMILPIVVAAVGVTVFWIVSTAP